MSNNSYVKVSAENRERIEKGWDHKSIGNGKEKDRKLIEKG